MSPSTLDSVFDKCLCIVCLPTCKLSCLSLCLCYSSPIMAIDCQSAKSLWQAFGQLPRLPVHLHKYSLSRWDGLVKFILSVIWNPWTLLKKLLSLFLFLSFSFFFCGDGPFEWFSFLFHSHDTPSPSLSSARSHEIIFRQNVNPSFLWPTWLFVLFLFFPFLSLASSCGEIVLAKSRLRASSAGGETLALSAMKELDKSPFWVSQCDKLVQRIPPHREQSASAPQTSLPL